MMNRDAMLPQGVPRRVDIGKIQERQSSPDEVAKDCDSAEHDDPPCYSFRFLQQFIGLLATILAHCRLLRFGFVSKVIGQRANTKIVGNQHIKNLIVSPIAKLRSSNLEL